MTNKPKAGSSYGETITLTVQSTTPDNSLPIFDLQPTVCHLEQRHRLHILHV